MKCAHDTYEDADDCERCVRDERDHLRQICANTRRETIDACVQALKIEKSRWEKDHRAVYNTARIQMFDAAIEVLQKDVK